MLTTVSDRKVAFDQNTDGTIDFFRADVISAQDYYAFGMIMPGRKFSAGGSYRYGFNGKEEDDDVKGDGNQQDYGMRIYDPRLGRFLSKDFLSGSYSSESPFIFAGNSPLALTDWNGLFKISPYFAQRYPTLARLLSEYLPKLKYNTQIRDAWIETVGFNIKSEGIKAFEEMVTFGSGPWITPGLDKNLSVVDMTTLDFFDISPFAGRFNTTYPDNLGISSYNLDYLESAVKKNDANEIALQSFFISTLIMHEASHWGMWKFKSKTNQDPLYEDGARFEENAFGTRFSYTKPRIADYTAQALDIEKASSYFNQNIVNNTKNSVFFGTTIYQFNYASPKWNDVNNRRPVRGQSGDPVLKSNRIREVFKASNTYENGNSSGTRASNNTYNE